VKLKLNFLEKRLADLRSVGQGGSRAAHGLRDRIVLKKTGLSYTEHYRRRVIWYRDVKSRQEVV